MCLLVTCNLHLLKNVWSAMGNNQLKLSLQIMNLCLNHLVSGLDPCRVIRFSRWFQEGRQKLILLLTIDPYSQVTEFG